MIARVAESCLWLQRYVERFDYTARLISINLETLLDVELPPEEHWRPLLDAAGVEDSFVGRHGAAARDDGETVQAYLTWCEENPVSILCSAQSARENARTIRETLSLEAWETLNRFWLWLSGGPGRRLYNRERESFYETLRQEALLFRGVCLETMPHDRPFDFLRLGSSLERAGQIARTLDAKYNQMAPIHREEAYEGSDQLTLWLALLRCSGCSEAFFKRGFPLEGKFVAEFMIFDRDHPRTILHNIERAWNFLQRIRPVRGARYSSARLLSGLREELLQASIDEVMARGVGRFLTSLVGALDLVGDAIGHDFFYAPLEIATAVDDGLMLDRAAGGDQNEQAQAVVSTTSRAVRGADDKRTEGVVSTTPRAVRGADDKRTEGVVSTTPSGARARPSP